jgi:hypothetical protein
MQSTKRLLNHPKVKQVLQELQRWLEAHAVESLRLSENEKEELYRRMFDQIRTQFDQVADDMSFPLLGDRKAKFDHVEALINEYNYLAKLIEDGKQKKSFATDMAIANFNNLYQMVRPLIRLRRKISSKYASYASHFSRYCQDLPADDVN